MTTEPDPQTAGTESPEEELERRIRMQSRREQDWLERDEPDMETAAPGALPAPMVDAAMQYLVDNLDREPAPMTKRQFMIAYVLGRCHGNTGGLDGRHVAHQANNAWDTIVKATEDG